MRITYFYPWDCFYPVRSGADTVAAAHMEYFRARGWAVNVVVPRMNIGRDEAGFRAHYSWLDSLTRIDMPIRPATLPDQLHTYETVARRADVRKLMARPTDLFFTNYAFTAPLLAALPGGCRRIVETHDIISHQQPGAAIEGTPGALSPAVYQRQREFLFRIEMDLYRLFDACLMISRDELAVVRDAGANNTHYVPRWLAPDDAPTTSTNPRFDLLFFGGRTLPNVRGLRWFYRNVYVPHLWRHGVRFGIAGGICGEPTLDYTDHNLTRLGTINTSPGELYSSAAVVVAPVFTGTGLSIKTAETLGAGKALVATPVAVRGLDKRSGAFEVVEMSTNPKGTAETILDLVHDPHRRRSLEIAARSYAMREFGRAAFFEAMDRVLLAFASDSCAA